ncbi:hypothetical protein HC928_23795 [bacterium]|nr:hypothetical protein [bacterium]
MNAGHGGEAPVRRRVRGRIRSNGRVASGSDAGAQGTLVLFFVVAPVAGLLWARQIRQRSTLVIAVAATLFIADLVLAGVVALGEHVASPADVSLDEWFIIGVLVGLVIALPVGRLLGWWLTGPPAYDPMGELRHLQTPGISLMPAQRKRLERLNKRRR